MNLRNAGRKVGYRKPLNDYRIQYADIIEMLKDGMTIRKIASESGVSTNTVLKIKRLF